MKNRSSKRKTMLITCAGGSSSIYLAKKLHSRFNIIMVDADNQNAGSQLGFAFCRVPFGDDPAFKPALKRIIKRYHVDIIVPGSDEELMSVSELINENRSLIGIIPRKAFLDLCLNKKVLMAALHKEGISNLCNFENKDSVSYPAVAKPIEGRGSRGVHVLNDKKQLDGYLKLYSKNFKDVLVQPYIGGREYTVSVIVNNLNQLIGIVPKRIITKRGITHAAVSERNRRIEAICTKIVSQFQPAGPFNVQLKLQAGKISVFEINPRLSTTSVLTDRCFGNEVELYIKYYNVTSVPRSAKITAPIYLYRYEENLFR